jgi:succinylglutamate desuccinylase
MQYTLDGLETISFSSQPFSRCFVIVGSTHGNEPAGRVAIEKMKELIATGDWLVDGDVYGLIGNPLAVKHGERFVEENLNRAFGRAEIPDSYEARRSADIFKWFEALSKEYKEMYLIDLHSVSMGETRIAIYNVENPKAGAWCREISPIPFVLAEHESVLPGALTNAFELLGGTAVAIECGNHASETGSTVALEHIENALLSLGMLKGQATSFKNKIAYEGEPRTYTLTKAIKPHEGFVWDLPVASEYFVPQGKQFAHDNLGIHVAVEDSYIIMPSKIPQPTDFDAGFLARKEA